MTIHNNYVNHCPNNFSPMYSTEPPAPAPSPELHHTDPTALESLAFDLDASDPIICDPMIFEDTTPDEIFADPLGDAVESEPAVSNHSASSVRSISGHVRSISGHASSEPVALHMVTSASTPSFPQAYEILAEPVAGDEPVANEYQASESPPESEPHSTHQFYYQEPSSVIERESTAPCVSPEPSQTSVIEDVNHYRPELALPFIDADSVSSLVGNDDLRRLRSVKRQDDAPKPHHEVRIAIVPEIKPVVSTEPEKKSEESVEVVQPRRPSKQENHVGNNHTQHAVVQPQEKAQDQEVQQQQEQYQQPIQSTSTGQATTTVIESPEDSKLPLIAVSRVESVKTVEGAVGRLLTAVRSRSLRRKKPKQKTHTYKSRSENRARKALRTITFILGAFIVLWTPFYVLATIYGFCESCKSSKAFNMLYSISYYLCYMNSPLNPFCYAMANQQFKKTLTRIFKGDFRRI
ncbi:hypothetical protein ANCCEY_13779 [Ancylostoma ceylanicum]|uniref:G-protein coupled receptors family 1 profile domain-containing protein n=1 Tax=Ancylostoma ceylanicum TaxID=53326 RepID=A0A0D6L6R2_9BILA|nr:hypothetical protein ANCCEY_13779 [Ancylostoma ceylanicum]